MSNDSKFMIILLMTILFNLISYSCAACDEEDEWECDDGTCIAIEDSCNGRIECPDSSDETAIVCNHKYCQKYGFRCGYGACIAGTKKCNGVQDCVDGSDEAKLLCSSDDDREKYLQNIYGLCKEEDVFCDMDGSCVDADHVCDGKIDCPDQSDEAIELCYERSCGAFGFKCGSGACVPGTSKCNGTTECFDGSDESWALCKTSRRDAIRPTTFTTATTPKVSITEAPPIIPTTPTRPSGPIGFPSEPGAQPCFAPPSPVVLRSRRTNTTYDSFIPHKTVLEVSCSQDASKAEVPWTLCDNGQLNPKPRCLTSCRKSDIYRDFSTVIQCKYENETIMCKDLLPFGTKVEFHCATYFRFTQRVGYQQCGADGRWYGTPRSCDMQCGQIFASRQFSKDGIPVRTQDVPWHAGLYNKVNDITYSYVCSASIISPILLITASHCVVDLITNEVKEVDTFRIIVDSDERKNRIDGEDKQYPLKTMYKNINYNAAEQYANDIAILVLQDALTFSTTIRPICLEGRKLRGEQEQVTGIQGFLSAWGKTTKGVEVVSDIETLQRIPAIQSSYSDCKRRPGSGSKLTSDKFCINITYGVACKGDSGAGYVVEENRKHYLRGVLSNADTDADGCASVDILVVNVYYFLNWIYEIIDFEDDLYRRGKRD